MTDVSKDDELIYLRQDLEQMRQEYPDEMNIMREEINRLAIMIEFLQGRITVLECEKYVPVSLHNSMQIGIKCELINQREILTQMQEAATYHNALMDLVSKTPALISQWETFMVMVKLSLGEEQQA